MYMAKKLILSLDYDGCADILFEEIHLKNIPFIKLLLSLVEQQKFNDYLDKLSSNEDYDTIELRIGSTRQSEPIDHWGAMMNSNGYCFSNFQKLSLKKYRKNNKWTFNEERFPGIINDTKINLVTTQLNQAKEK